MEWLFLGSDAECSGIRFQTGNSLIAPSVIVSRSENEIYGFSGTIRAASISGNTILAVGDDALVVRGTLP